VIGSTFQKGDQRKESKENKTKQKSFGGPTWQRKTLE
jgi:hypothetical protein